MAMDAPPLTRLHSSLARLEASEKHGLHEIAHDVEVCDHARRRCSRSRMLRQQLHPRALTAADVLSLLVQKEQPKLAVHRANRASAALQELDELWPRRRPVLGRDGLAQGGHDAARS